MKKNIYVIAVFTLLLFFMSNSAFADEKIGFVNIREVFSNSNTGKKAEEEFKALAEKKSAPLKSMENELRKMKDDLEKQGSMMSDSTRRSKEAAFQKKSNDFQLMAQKINEELHKKDKEMTQKVIPEIFKIVRTIAEKGKYTLVLDTSTMVVPYFNKENDITSKVLDEFNKASR